MSKVVVDPARAAADRQLAAPAVDRPLAAPTYVPLAIRRDDGPTWVDATDVFHARYYAAAREGGTWKGVTWAGVPIHKCPLDLWVYQELLWQVRPTIMIETGTFAGGSALWFATCMDAYGMGQVITIDRERPARRELPGHPRIRYIRGDTRDPHTHAQVRCAVLEALVEREGPILVSLDGDHTEGGVLAELNAFAAYVTPGSYLVVEDTNLGGHPIHAPAPHDHDGPAAALAAWLPTHPEFQPDPACERHLLTFNPGGWLKRV